MILDFLIMLKQRAAQKIIILDKIICFVILKITNIPAPIPVYSG